MPAAPRYSMWREGAPLLVGAVLALLFLEVARHHVFTVADEAGLGRETTAVLHRVGDEIVACADATDSAQCVAGYVRKGRPPSILLLGNSQLYAINHFKEGQRTTPTLLHEKLLARGYYLVTYSEPNANLFEHGLVFAALAPQFHPKLLIVPVFLDKIREQGVRSAVSDLLDNPAARDSVMASPLWPMLRPLIDANRKEATPAAEEDTSFHLRFEHRLNDALASVSDLWTDRMMLQGTAKVGMFRLRNLVLGINSRTKRKVDPTVYREKMAALEATLQDARSRNVRVLLYLPPYRQDIDGPNVASDYAALKKDLAALAEKYGAVFADIDSIVPGPEWAKTVDVLFGVEDEDFVHFTAEGHRRHAEALDAVLRRMGF